MRRGICSAGNWIVDNIKIIDIYPEEENLANILEESEGTGGAPYNVLIDLARMDSKLYLEGIGVIGKDEKGKKVLKDIKKYGINPIGIIQTDKEPTSYTDVMTVKSTGRRTFFHNRGANKLLGFEHFPFEKIKAKILHIGYALLLDKLDSFDKEYGTVMAKVFAFAKRYGIKTSLDVVSESDKSRYKKVVFPSLKYVDYLIVNEIETENLTDIKLRDKKGMILLKNFKKAADILFQKGVNEIIVIHMPEGGFLFTKQGEEIFQPSHLLPEGYIKGTVGAGDAFCAGVLYGLHEDMNYNEIMRLATACAALNLSSVSATEGMLPLKEVLNFADKTPYRKIEY